MAQVTLAEVLERAEPQIAAHALDDLTVQYVHQAALPTNTWNALFPIIPSKLFRVSSCCCSRRTWSSRS